MVILVIMIILLENITVLFVKKIIPVFNLMRIKISFKVIILYFMINVFFLIVKYVIKI